MSSISKRISYIAENEGISITAMERVIGASKGVLSRALMKNTDIQSKWLTAIVENYPPYSSEWLLTGEGEMLKPVTTPNSIVRENGLVYSNNSRSIPLVDIESAAGAGAINQDNIEVLEYITLPNNALSHHQATYYAIKNRGDSMFPTIHDKDILIVRQLDASEWQDLRDEYVYIVVDREGNAYTKRIKNRLNRGFIVCMSDNLDKANHPNFTLENEELSYLFYVELKISAHLPNINSSYFHRLKDLEDRFDEFEREVKLLKGNSHHSL